MKFRVYDNVDKKYVGTGISNNLFVITQSGLLFEYNLKGTFEEAYPDRYTVEESTGLTDKNGVEIYVSDKVKVQLASGGFASGNILQNDGCCDIEFDVPVHDGILNRRRDYLKCYICNHAVEIIGNIHGGKNER